MNRFAFPVLAPALVAATFACGCGENADAPGDAAIEPDAPAPEPPRAWVRSFGGAGLDRVIDVAIAADGDVLVAGQFRGTIEIDGTTLTTAEPQAAVLARFTPGGTLRWAHSLAARIEGIAVDAAGNLYVGGDFEGTVDLGGGPATADGLSDAFVLALDATGTHRWHRTFGGAGFDGVQDVAVAGDRLAITGDFQGVADFGTGPQTSRALQRDGFVAVYTTAGVPQWADAIGGDADGDQGRAVAIAPDGSIAATGLCDGLVGFGGYAETSDVRDGAFDMFVVVYPAGGGMPTWVKRFGANELTPAAITIDSGARAIVTGTFSGTVRFGDDDHVTHGSDDIFLVSLTSSGAVAWARTIGGVAIDAAADLSRAGGDVIVTGTVMNRVDLGGGEQGEVNSVGDLFLARYAVNGGAHVSSERLHPGDPFDESRGTAIAVGPVGQLVVAGQFQGTATVDGVDLVSRGAEDGIVIQRLP